ncbi:predicted protein [Streptomyces sp. AA4]|nr:predicted protein [Streptomyces sp. AA4]
MLHRPSSPRARRRFRNDRRTHHFIRALAVPGIFSAEYGERRALRSRRRALNARPGHSRFNNSPVKYSPGGRKCGPGSAGLGVAEPDLPCPGHRGDARPGVRGPLRRSVAVVDGLPRDQSAVRTTEPKIPARLPPRRAPAPAVSPPGGISPRRTRRPPLGRGATPDRTARQMSSPG